MLDSFCKRGTSEIRPPIALPGLQPGQFERAPEAAGANLASAARESWAASGFRRAAEHGVLSTVSLWAPDETASGIPQEEPHGMAIEAGKWAGGI
jgi:hypothetical protein